MEWATEYNLEPFERETDRRHAMLMTLLAKPTGEGEWDRLYESLMPKRSRSDFEDRANESDSPSVDAIGAVLSSAATMRVIGVRPKEED